MADGYIVGFCPDCQHLLVPLVDACPGCERELLGVRFAQAPSGLGDPDALQALPHPVEVGVRDRTAHAVLIAELLLRCGAADARA